MQQIAVQNHFIFRILNRAYLFIRKVLYVLLRIAFSPLVLIVILLKPLIIIRFGSIRSDRIGHFSVDVEAYLCARDQRKPIHKTIDIIGCPQPVSNRQLERMWKRTFRITPVAQIWRVMDDSCRFWTRKDTHHVKLYDRSKDYNLFLTAKSHLSFTEEEHQKGKEQLGHLGIPTGAPWVCVYNRDSNYLDKSCNARIIHHDYRNFSVKSLLSAANELSGRGYYVIRVGSMVEEPFISSDSKIIDYSNCPFQSDFMDIYLLANCTFFLGSDSGIFCIPWLFKKLVIKTNFTVLRGLNIAPGLYILKSFWNKEQQKFLSLKEIFENGLANADQSFFFEQAGVELICNTQEEIRDLAMEADERLKGCWHAKSEDELLQNRFWEIFYAHAPQDSLRRDTWSYLGKEKQVLIGANFLRKHKYLLD